MIMDLILYKFVNDGNVFVWYLSCLQKSSTHPICTSYPYSNLLTFSLCLLGMCLIVSRSHDHNYVQRLYLGSRLKPFKLFKASPLWHFLLNILFYSPYLVSLFFFFFLSCLMCFSAFLVFLPNRERL